MAKILLAGAVDQAAMALLEARGDVNVELLEQATASDLEARIAEVDALVLRLAPVREQAVAKADRLKVVSRHGVGYDNVDVAALTRRGIPLAVVGDANAVTVAEHALGLMVAVARRFMVLDQAVRRCDYGTRDPGGQSELFGKTVLVVGFGRIGPLVAKRCAAFDMTVVVADPFIDGAAVRTQGYRYVEDFRDALAEADFVTLHMPGQQDGRPVMAAPEFQAMKPGAYLINVARGTLLDEAALAEALTGGHLRGAGLDVTRREPPTPDNPLLALENVVFTPHTAALTEECARRMGLVSVQNALDAIDGCLKPEFVVNKEVLG